MTLDERFEQFEDEFLEFGEVVVRLSERPDLHAFLLLDRLAPGQQDMVSSAEHDEIWLGVDTELLNDVITDAQILELVRCGVHCESDGGEGLCMFV